MRFTTFELVVADLLDWEFCADISALKQREVKRIARADRRGLTFDIILLEVL
jgi:hypothetical protein